MAIERKIKRGSATDLEAVLRFVPRTYRIELSGYGGEIVVGAVKKETYDYFTDNEIHIEELANDVDNDLELPPEHQLFSAGGWYNCDDLCHEVGVEFTSGGTVTVYDEHGNVVWESNLDPLVLKNKGCRADLHNTFTVQSQPDGSVVFIGQTFEKGTFFSGEIDLREPFDPKLLGFGYSTVNSWNVGIGVEYNDEYIENQDMDTVERDVSYELVIVENRATGVQLSSYQPREWELSQEWAGTIAPVHNGWYNCVYTIDGAVAYIGQLMWIGDAWMLYRNGKFAEITNVVAWQGLNWDTSDMANRPVRKG